MSVFSHLKEADAEDRHHHDNYPIRIYSDLHESEKLPSVKQYDKYTLCAFNLLVNILFYNVISTLHHVLCMGLWTTVLCYSDKHR